VEEAAARDVTRLLRELRTGDSEAKERLVSILYEDLRERAARQMRCERPDHTLQATALANEAWLRLAAVEQLDFIDRAHFFAVSATCIRHILVDHARRCSARRRSAGGRRIELDQVDPATQTDLTEILDLDAALERFASVDARKARAVELRFFGGLTNDEVAESLGVSLGTVERDLRLARAWLQRELSGGGAA